MILYEVNLDIDAAIASEYRQWLHAHMAEILALPGFINAQVFDELDPAPRDGRVALCVQYRLEDMAALQHYLEMHAPAMREDGQRRFGSRFSATRRVLSVTALAGSA